MWKSVCHYFSFILPMKITCVLVRAVLYCLLKMHYFSCGFLHKFMFTKILSIICSFKCAILFWRPFVNKTFLLLKLYMSKCHLLKIKLLLLLLFAPPRITTNVASAPPRTSPLLHHERRLRFTTDIAFASPQTSPPLHHGHRLCSTTDVASTVGHRNRFTTDVATAPPWTSRPLVLRSLHFYGWTAVCTPW